ncbi:hypothetical protein INS49_003226 [Diaporthe citri]|uniref:uncharacterized protein n=1 Tax=Diaporthe citri TaxID=83186 RepID=UPI001C803A78|nr:uncharacterized protein INS49_003226 [Diaporthe citri]KAG6369007.1 hypothetical protein INS49_003226 [Diaporthe citri]
MPSLFKSKAKSNGESKDDTPSQPTHRPNGSLHEAPPAYAAAQPVQNPPDVVDITAAFSSLNISPTPQDPTVDTCLAHLKLLYALQSLKEDVGYTDGLWDIWDSRADGQDSDIDTELPDDLLPPSAAEAVDLRGSQGEKGRLAPSDIQKIRLSKIREKRWALFVARAVDRYEAWWNVFPKTMLREADMNDQSGAKYHHFVDETAYLRWTQDMLPPLDVLMVWHAHMLNPRAYLEDTLRCGLSSLWATGMPWGVISSAIDTDFNYDVSAETKAAWVASTGRNWENADDATTKHIKCPACQITIEHPWTNCGAGEASKTPAFGGLVGSGYGDGQFKRPCPSCGIQIDKELLSVAKFTKDAQSLVVNSVPMPGTILDPIKGSPEPVPIDMRGPTFPRTFPNRMIASKLISQIAGLVQPGSTPRPTMENVRDKIEEVLRDGVALREIEGRPAYGRGRIFTAAKICVRKMMSRYWENFSPFALDLSGAVMRQGVFTGKMYQIDWLHSPACRETMTRLVKKYERFISLMADNPTKTCVPTLDVDLAWHTHQLSPSAYYAYTTARTTKFIDHDDKIDEDKLSDCFAWTVKAYQAKYSVVYSECTCWYCETIRSTHINTVSRVLGVSDQDKAAENFHASGQAQFCPPDKSAHISSHNAVRAAPDVSSAKERLTAYARDRKYRQLELNYEKARRRAEKKGRKLPPRDQYYDHWGYSYFMYSPFIYPMYFTPGMYYGWDPGLVVHVEEEAEAAVEAVEGEVVAVAAAEVVAAVVVGEEEEDVEGLIEI